MGKMSAATNNKAEKNQIPKTDQTGIIIGSKSEIEFHQESLTFIVVKPVVFLTVLFLFVAAFSKAQAPPVVSPKTILVTGYVFDLNDTNALPAPIIVNKRMQTGQSFAAGGQFSLSGLQTDTFLITAGGYEVKRICFHDSIPKDVYALKIGLSLRTNLLKSVSIYPVKDLNAIKREREALGVVETRQTIGVTDAFESPITYMYDRFSKYGKSRAEVAQLENQDKIHEVLKDLFRTYISAGVIDLDESEFDEFINYLNLPESYLKTASDYELAVTIKQRYLQYVSAKEIHNRNQR
jgi:hypothetical protein